MFSAFSHWSCRLRAARGYCSFRSVGPFWVRVSEHTVDWDARTSRLGRRIDMRSAVVLLALVLAFLPPSTSNPVAAPTFSAWGAPVNLGPVVNSSFLDGGPGI